jgi:hypothetical protein
MDTIYIVLGCIMAFSGRQGYMTRTHRTFHLSWCTGSWLNRLECAYIKTGAAPVHLSFIMTLPGGLNSAPPKANLFLKAYDHGDHS